MKTSDLKVGMIYRTDGRFPTYGERVKCIAIGRSDTTPIGKQPRNGGMFQIVEDEHEDEDVFFIPARQIRGLADEVDAADAIKKEQENQAQQMKTANAKALQAATIRLAAAADAFGLNLLSPYVRGALGDKHAFYFFRNLGVGLDLDVETINRLTYILTEYSNGECPACGYIRPSNLALSLDNASKAP